MSDVELKTFKADSMREALRLVREELGPDAIIVRTRQLSRPGLLGHRPSGVEIVAGKGMVTGVATTSAPTATPREDREIEGLFRDEELSDSFVEQAAQTFSEGRGDVAIDRIIEWLASSVRWDARVVSGSRTMAALVGPSGSGKTITAAKLAAQAVRRGQSVGLIAADFRKIGASDQLARLAELLDVSFAEVADASEMNDARQSLGDLDLLLVDTPSLPGLDARGERRLAELLPADAERLLVMPLTVRDSVATRAIDAAAPLAPSRLIVTKYDESPHLGPVISMARRAGLPLAFVGTGDRVIEDLAPADPRIFAARLMEKNAPSRQPAGL